MAVRFYDDALLAKFQRWTKDTGILLTGINDTKTMFSVTADRKNDNPIQLPLITLSRPGGYDILMKYKQPLSHSSLTIAQNSNYGAKLNAIPIDIHYQIDIYCRHLAEADEYARNIVFNIINYPVLEIEIPYEDIKFSHKGNIRLITSVEDNSDIPERLIPGQFTRLTIGVSIDDAYLFDVRIKDNISIVEGQLSIIDKDAVDTELIFNRSNN